METENWLVRLNGEEQGVYTASQLYRVAMELAPGQMLEFKSYRTGEWRAVKYWLEDQSPVAENLKRISEAGISHARWMSSGTGEDCEICRALDGRIFLIRDFPPLPPMRCKCSPWCRCIPVPADGR